MNTQFIGIKDFRAHISDYAKRAQTEDKRFVVVNHNKPLFEVTPFKEDETLSSLFNDILVAKKDVEEGKVHTHEDIMAELA